MTLACGTTTASVTLEGQVISNDVDQVVTLPQGASWWSTNLDITLEDLKAAIANALGSTGTATIKSQTGYITYSNGQWSPSTGMTLDLRQMYMIQVSATCTFTLTGVPVNPSNYEHDSHCSLCGSQSGEWRCREGEDGQCHLQWHILDRRVDHPRAWPRLHLPIEGNK